MLKKAILSALLFYSVFGFFILPYILKFQLQSIVAKEFYATLFIEKISFNPFNFVLEANSVVLNGNDKKTIASFDRLNINLEPHSFLRSTLHAKSIFIENPSFFITYNQDKEFNFKTLLRPKTDTSTNSQERFKLPKIIIESLKIQDGMLAYEEPDFVIWLHSIDMRVNDFESIESIKSADFRLYGMLSDGTEIRSKGNLISLEPLKIDGNLNIDAMSLYTAWRYMKERTPLEVADGKLFLDTHYRLDLNDTNATFLDALNLHVQDLRIKPKEKNSDILNLSSLLIQNATIKPMHRDAHVKNITIDGLSASIERDKSEKIDFLEYFNNTQSTQKADKTQENAQTWRVLADVISIKGGKVDFKDMSVTPIAEAKINHLHAEIKNFTLHDKNLKMDADLHLKNFTVTKKESKEALLSFKNLDFYKLVLDTKMQEAKLHKVTLEGLESHIFKRKNATFALGDLLEFKPHEEEQNKKSIQDKYSGKLDVLEIIGAKLHFQDQSVENSAKVNLDEIYLQASNITSEKNSPFSYKLSLKNGKEGTLVAEGEAAHTPLWQKGKISLCKISLSEFSSYLKESTFLAMSDGDFTLDAATLYTTKGDFTMNGALSVENFFLHDSRDNAIITSFVKADLKSFAFKSNPASLFVEEALLDSFYIDAMIDEEKNINLSKLLKDGKKEQNSTLFDFKLIKLSVKRGSANFADYSLPIDFKTSIHDLNGALYALSNTKGEIAYVEVDGEVDEYGSTELKGSFEPSNIKSFLDIDFNFRNLNLSSLSGYSAQFAGYKIDDGKLFLDLNYQINNAQLLSKNSIVIKNIKLGDEIEDENITKLPLGFAIALLENSDGIIDIDMPIEGDVDKPDFKYGTIVANALSSLITKAITAPFTFLAKLIGVESKELENIEFEAGEAIISPPQREKLDNLAKILKQKPLLSLRVGGTFEKQRDTEALKLLKLRKKAFEITKQEYLNIPTLARIYVQSSGNIKSLQEALRAKLGMEFSDKEYQKELYEKLLNAQTISDKELLELADERAKNIINYLSASKGVDIKRAVQIEPKEVQNSEEKFITLQLELSAK